MFALEDTHWWYVGLRELLLFEIERHNLNDEVWIFDAGCGTGGTLEVLKSLGRSFSADLSPQRLDLARIEA